MQRSKDILIILDDILKYHFIYRRVFRTYFPKHDGLRIMPPVNIDRANNPFNVQITFQKPIDEPTRLEMNRISLLLNQNIIIRLYGTMEYFKYVGNDIKIDHSLNGADELDIVRRLRKYFSHTSGRFNPSNSEEKQLYDRVIKHFELRPNIDYDIDEFPIPIEPVITGLFNGCKNYVKASNMV